MVYSVQQIKFELLSYIKEFGGRAEEWRMGLTNDARQALFADHRVNESADIWLWKPALSPIAARTVYRYMTEQLHVPPVEPQGEGRCVFLFKKTGWKSG